MPAYKQQAPTEIKFILNEIDCNWFLYHHHPESLIGLRAIARNVVLLGRIRRIPFMRLANRGSW